MDRFLENFNLPRPNQEVIEIMNNWITSTEIEAVGTPPAPAAAPVRPWSWSWRTCSSPTSWCHRWPTLGAGAARPAMCLPPSSAGSSRAASAEGSEDFPAASRSPSPTPCPCPAPWTWGSAYYLCCYPHLCQVWALTHPGSAWTKRLGLMMSFRRHWARCSSG